MVDFLIVLGIIVGFIIIVAALTAIVFRKNYAIGIIVGVLGIILILGMIILKENKDRQAAGPLPTVVPSVTMTPIPGTETPLPSPENTENLPENTGKPATAKPGDTSAPDETNAPEVSEPGGTATAVSHNTPIPKGDFGEIHYDSTTIVKPDNWNGKTIYLTFDDGPSKTTERVLNNLAKYNVKCTFFEIGSQVSDYLPYVKRALDEGHTVGIHAYQHEYNIIYASVDAYVSDFNKCAQVFREKLGYNPTIFRFPGGTSNTTSKQYCKGIMTQLSQLMPESGYNYCDWNVSPEDAMSKMTVDQIFEATKKEILSTSNVNKYVLMHDYGGMENTADAALKIIEWGLENGYAFDRLTPETPLYQHGVNN